MLRATYSRVYCLCGGVACYATMLSLTRQQRYYAYLRYGTSDGSISILAVKCNRCDKVGLYEYDECLDFDINERRSVEEFAHVNRGSVTQICSRYV